MNIEIVRRRLDRLSEYLEILARYRNYSLEEFLADPEKYGSAERFLQLAVEVVIDLGNHIVAERGLGSVEKSRDVPALFKKHGLIDRQLEQKWIQMIGFRNVLVHEYARLDRRLVYQMLTDRLDDLGAMRRLFANFL
jgi:uncharacterized protein YutE (UPF0331/DUF86 family)